MALFDASTLFENRILAPMEVSFLIVVLALISKGIAGRQLYQQILIVGLLVLVAFFWFRDGRSTVSVLQQDGQGFASLSWQNSPTIEYIRTLPPDKKIYTNKNTGVFLLTGRNAYRILSRMDPVTLKPRENYAEQLALIHRDVSEGIAVLIFFGADQQTEPEDRAWLEDLRSGLTIYEDFEDSEVYDR
jgi:hypothetical protein